MGGADSLQRGRGLCHQLVSGLVSRIRRAPSGLSKYLLLPLVSRGQFSEVRSRGNHTFLMQRLTHWRLLPGSLISSSPWPCRVGKCWYRWPPFSLVEKLTEHSRRCRWIKQRGHPGGRKLSRAAGSSEPSQDSTGHVFTVQVSQHCFLCEH